MNSEIEYKEYTHYRENETLNLTVVMSGLGSEKLAYDIAQYLGIQLCDIVLSHFGNGETRVEINNNIRNCHVILVAQMRTGTVNDDFMSLVMLIDACRRADASKITVVMPYYPYSRSDKKDRPRVPISSATIAHILNMYNVDNVISLDLHAGQSQGLIDRGFHNLYMINYVAPYISLLRRRQDMVLVSPDVGGIKRIEAYSKKLKMDHIILHKIRDYNNPGTVLRSVIIGEPEQYQGKVGIIIDDMADSMGTMVSATNALVEHGMKEVIIIVTHGIFSGKAIERINACEHITRVYCTDSLPQEHNVIVCPKIAVIGCGSLISNALKAILNGESVSVLFD